MHAMFYLLTAPAVVAIAQCNIRRIQARFSRLVVQACRRLQTRDINVKVVKVFLITMYSSPTSRDGSYLVTTVVESAKSLDEIFRALSKYGFWDYLNYYLLQSIIEEFASDDDELNGMIEEYQKDLTGHFLTLKIQTYMEATYDEHSIATSESDNLVDLESLPPQQKRMLFKKLSCMVRANITEASLRYVCDLWNSLLLKFALPRLPVILYDIAEVCCLGISMHIIVCVNVELGPVVVIH